MPLGRRAVAELAPALMAVTPVRGAPPFFDVGRGTVDLDADSSVSGNTPDDCLGTDAC